MRVATLNVWARSGDWPARRQVLVDGFRGLRPDLVALQETIKTPDYDQAADILGPAFHLAQQARRGGDGMGVSIASRWPLGPVHELDLHLAATPRADAFPCTTLAAEVRVPDLPQPLLFVNHFPSWQLDFEFEREQQTVAAARFIDELRAGRDLHVVLAGDLDADPQAASVRFWCGRQSLGGRSVCYRDAWERCHPGEPGATMAPDRNPLVADPDWPFGRIDYILVRCAEHGGPTLPIRACRRIFDQPDHGRSASDHFGLLAELG
jgi:endonuclease/exonuclease/phosphatase family metal-dependent hydrolase